MTNFHKTGFAVSGLLIFATSIVPASAEVRPGPPVRHAEMMGMQPQAAPGAGMADDKMKDGMGMGMRPMTPAQPQAAPGGGMKPGMGDDKMAMPGGCCMPMMQPPGGMAASPGGMAGTGVQPMPQQARPSAPLDHMEGRIAFLRTELGITAEQSQVWEQFAQALRTGQEHQGAARQALVTSSGGQYGAPDRLEAHERHLSLRLESLRTARESFQRLYAVMNATQKQNADQLVLPVLVSF